MNAFFNAKFHKKEKTYRRNYEIEESLYIKLRELAQYYAVSVAALVNVCVEQLIASENIIYFMKRWNVILLSSILFTCGKAILTAWNG